MGVTKILGFRVLGYTTCVYVDRGFDMKNMFTSGVQQVL
jgi:hypothetical protein